MLECLLIRDTRHLQIAGMGMFTYRRMNSHASNYDKVDSDNALLNELSVSIWNEINRIIVHAVFNGAE